MTHSSRFEAILHTVKNIANFESSRPFLRLTYLKKQTF